MAYAGSALLRPHIIAGVKTETRPWHCESIGPVLVVFAVELENVMGGSHAGRGMTDRKPAEKTHSFKTPSSRTYLLRRAFDTLHASDRKVREYFGFGAYSAHATKANVTESGVQKEQSKPWEDQTRNLSKADNCFWQMPHATTQIDLGFQGAPVQIRVLPDPEWVDVVNDALGAT
ncbi:hypothetical protein EI94DRAFT_1700865 [Lactarius quietus]|nr:hypothetical protein EI94DRAFT_1700865 [Lactarius quietus]